MPLFEVVVAGLQLGKGGAQLIYCRAQRRL